MSYARKILTVAAGAAAIVTFGAARSASASAVGNSDTTGDGIVDTVEADGNGDGYVDVVASDLNQNGVFERVIFDTNADGYFEATMDDHEDDGVADVVAFDSDLDGDLDTFFPIDQSLGSAGVYSPLGVISAPTDPGLLATLMPVFGTAVWGDYTLDHDGDHVLDVYDVYPNDPGQS